MDTTVKVSAESVLINGDMTIFEAMQKIINGNFVIPAFQRPFVWDMARMEKLWDSILLNYPISNFLFWHIDENNTTPNTYFMTFLEKLVFTSKLQANKANNMYDLSRVDLNHNDTAILDGQQRLTSLYISLYKDVFIKQGRSSAISVAKLYIELNKNRLDFNNNSAEEKREEYNDKKYDIRFTTKIGIISPTWFEIRKILELENSTEEERKDFYNKAISKVPPDSRDYAKAILEKLYKKIFKEKLIRYTQIDNMMQDDALEMFVRFNSGGRPLKKAEITMSILQAYWPQAKDEIGKVLVGDFKDFDSDFIIRTALMLYGNVVKSTIDTNIANNMKNYWGDFKKALTNLADVFKKLKIDLNRFSSSWNILLPIIYMIYYNPEDYEENLKDIKAYIIRAVFFCYYNSGTTAKLQQMKNNMNAYGCRISVDMLDQMPDLAITPGKIDDLFTTEKGSRLAGEILYYISTDWYNSTVNYHQDHIHPFERFDKSKPFTVSASDWTKWRSLRNKLANIELLTGRENESKGDMPLIDYYNTMTKSQQIEFVEHSYIPISTASLEFDDFEKFYNERKILLTEKIKKLMNGI